MKPTKKLANHPDVVMIYQDREIAEPAIQQLMELELDFKAFKYDPKKMHAIAEMKAKVLLLSTNNVNNTIQLYIDYLEEFEGNIAHHSAVLLINNRETYRAYLACENGLFDDYAIINPLNEPYRLKLLLLQELKLIENHKNDSLEQLINEGEDELASCIEHGVALKKSFIFEVNKCEEDILSATNDLQVGNDAKAVLQNLIGLSLDEMNENVTNSIQDILDQLNELKSNSQAVQENFTKSNTPKNKTMVGVNAELLTSDDENAEHAKSACYKVLIAEPSDMFSRVVDKIFSDTVYKYVLVNDGKAALDKIHEFHPDVVLLAYDLPTIDGVEITKIIRDEGNQVPVVAYTQYKDREAIKRWIPFGLSGYLIKPSKKSAILKSITRAVTSPTEILEYHEKKVPDSIKWQTKYSVGNKDIDEQHRVLLVMLNDFFHQDNKESSIMLFHNIASYLELQFDSEENLLRQINYPDTEKHSIEHHELKDKMLVLQKKLEVYDLDVQHKIAMFVYSWLSKHILSSDMSYKAYALSIEEESFMN